ncbi:hypothetical protein DXG03_008806 [Asterophora parasitica]|uniref:Uncharacterized protein n=1 Tax=Asterophora parasitica TaxID=117018 RepID=A0A9P7FXK8_9AGAR|nr:hypothetical protein DXG03_008806 [Asterophora parasitica]
MGSIQERIEAEVDILSRVENHSGLSMAPHALPAVLMKTERQVEKVQGDRKVW